MQDLLKCLLLLLLAVSGDKYFDCFTRISACAFACPFLNASGSARAASVSPSVAPIGRRLRRRRWRRWPTTSAAPAITDNIQTHVESTFCTACQTVLLRRTRCFVKRILKKICDDDETREMQRELMSELTYKKHASSVRFLQPELHLVHCSSEGVCPDARRQTQRVGRGPNFLGAHAASVANCALYY
jgi:hypothetical protein